MNGTHVFLALDVSSSAAGHATFRDGRPADFGVIRPRASLPALDRIDAICAGVVALVAAHVPAQAVMEISGGHTHGRLAKARSLSVLGMSQGAVWATLKQLGITVVPVDESWTRRVPKHRRANTIAAIVPGYASFRVGGHDPGEDAADALGLALWHLGHRREAELIERAATAKGAGR